MEGPPPISETREGQMLERLAGLALELAISLQQRALAAETSEEAVRLAGAFHQVSRAVRQSIALKGKLIFQQRADERQDAPFREKARQARVSRRHTQVHHAVQRLIWTEHEGDEEEADELIDALGDRIDAEKLRDDFLDEPLDTQVARIARDLGLTSPDAAASAGGGPPAEEPVVEGESPIPDASDQTYSDPAAALYAPPAPSTPRSAARGPPPAA